MNILNAKSQELYFHDHGYLKKVLDQIQRDFNMTGISFVGNSEPLNVYAELYSLLLKNIRRLMKEDHKQFKNLLYRIDVSEISIHRKMALDKDLKLEEEISKLIIERCLLKVLTREKFSQ